MNSKLICWDAACFITWMLGQNGSNPERLPAIRTVFESINNGHYKLIASVLVYTEVVESKSPATMQAFRTFMQNRALIDVITVDIHIAEKAMRIRDKSLGKVEIPDAIHLATAIVSGAKVFHTFDEDLLKLSDSNIVDGLSITKCTIP